MQLGLQGQAAALGATWATGNSDHILVNMMKALLAAAFCDSNDPQHATDPPGSMTAVMDILLKCVMNDAVHQRDDA